MLARTRLPCRSLLGALGAILLCGLGAAAQDDAPPPLRLGGVAPSGVRTSATEAWAAYEFSVANTTDTDRVARVLAFYTNKPDIQYGRDLWVPARSTMSSWLLMGPAAAQSANFSRDIDVLLYDRTDGKDVLITPPGEQRRRQRAVPYRKRDPSTTTLLDLFTEDLEPSGRLPLPDSATEETSRLVRTFRLARELSGFVSNASAGPLPPVPEAFDGVDHFVIASRRIADDAVGLRALRQWVERGGKVWVLLDLVDPDVAAPLLGEEIDFQVVDRVSLTSFRVDSHPRPPRLPEPQLQQYERPVDFVRVLLPPGEQPRLTIDGWPAAFSRSVGRGKVVFTTLGARGWYRPRTAGDPRPSGASAALPVPLPHMDLLSDELQSMAEDEAFQADAFRGMLNDEIGYTVVRRDTIAWVLGAFLAVTLLVGLALRRSRRPELLGWLAPVAALIAAGILVGLGESARRAVPPMVASGQIVDPSAGTPEAAVRGLLAVYRPTEGPAEVGAEQGGLFELDLAGTEGQTRRLIWTDLDAWHWENLSLPAGVRTAPFRLTAPTGEPMTAVARFGPEGLEGKVTTGPFQNVADAVLHSPAGRPMAVRLGNEGTFAISSEDVLAPGQYLAGTLLTDQQQRRQELYRQFLRRPTTGRSEGRTVLLAWADAVETHFRLTPPGTRQTGTALLVMPLRLERPAAGTQVKIPGPLMAYRRLRDGVSTRPTLEGSQEAEMHLRFQVPATVLPLRVERARLLARIDAPSRRVTVGGRAGEQVVELHHVESPLDPIRVDIRDERLLRLDETGGLHVNVSLSKLLGHPDAAKGGAAREADRWTIRYIELEVIGRTEQ